MTTLTVNIDNQTSEKAVKDFLENLGLAYSIDAKSSEYAWWEDKTLLQELDQRSKALKNGKDPGASFEEIKRDLLSR